MRNMNEYEREVLNRALARGGDNLMTIFDRDSIELGSRVRTGLNSENNKPVPARIAAIVRRLKLRDDWLDTEARRRALAVKRTT